MKLYPIQCGNFKLDGGAMSVSYTHLDVYKRQELMSGIKQFECIRIFLNSYTVSYTHLDVYKRQVFIFSGFKTFSALA